ncbi:unnamed protein product [Didymodactylos carnosus]|uniref:Receptor ligand binding region domain-containing protein n=1 Tax=Didymodactylos carnosus TaxID=1234261 RepID=A0A8S2XZ57_9BILA|nr:unnamed protein product [Didymodactylos carnosus]
MFKSALTLSHLYNITYLDYPLGWQEYEIVDSGNDNKNNSMMNELDLICQAVSKSNTIGIIGSINSLVALFAQKIGIPTIAFSDYGLLNRNQYSTLYRVLPSDTTTALALVQLFKRYQWTQCTIIHTNDDYGLNGINVITEQFINNGLLIANAVRFDTRTQTIQNGNFKQLLYRSFTRIVLVWADLNSTMLILDSALRQNLIGLKFLWILTSNITLDKYTATERKKFTGMFIMQSTVGSVMNDPINTTLLNDAFNIWQQYERKTFPGYDSVSSQALFTFDATWTLIQSLKLLNVSQQLRFSKCSTNCFKCQLFNVNYLINIVKRNLFLGLTGLVQYNTKTKDRLLNCSYFLIQNIQPTTDFTDVHFMSILKWSNNEWHNYIDHNLIVWPGMQLASFVDYPSLDGITLKICVVNVQPFVINGAIMTGYSLDLISLLQKRMGFIPEIILQPSNRTRDQLIDDLVNNVYDMVVG